MKSILRLYLASLAGLYVCQYFISGFKINGGVENLLISSGALALIYLIAKPILKILMLPINLLSLGLLSWVINVAILYLLTRLVPYISVSAWYFPGFSYRGFLLPASELNEMMVFILVSLLLSFVINLSSWLAK